MSENFDSQEKIPVPREGEVMRLIEGFIGEKPTKWGQTPFFRKKHGII